ncbi:hypothetical protein DERP_011355 [Dermatophagoides pteronyssinus]|uniref:Uncharacterized protein n=1 Tax=Dermatophagoides pteronyssinus TaxID=6956 RepID=A0ABQ8J7C9_DERPT|nr:hypothetical protein DERP_011355 [Dermatophagoides pteronyssinus]
MLILYSTPPFLFTFIILINCTKNILYLLIDSYWGKKMMEKTNRPPSSYNNDSCIKHNDPVMN